MSLIKRVIRISLILLLISNSILLTACASKIVSEATILENEPGVSTVTVIRQAGMVGGAIKLQTYIDNDLYAYVKPGKYVEIYTRPGVHILSVIFKNSVDVVRFYAEPNEKYYFFYSLDNSFLEQYTEKDAEDRIKKGNYRQIK